MNDPNSDEPLSLLRELRRRRVLYTAVVYGISAFAVTEIAAFVFENFGAPEWAERLLAALFVAGFPVAMFLSWAFDIGADGIVRDSGGGGRNRRMTIGLAIGLLLLATGGLFYLIFPEPSGVDAPPGGAGATVADYGFEPAEKLDNSVAVLPFENLSADPDDSFFSSGVAEEVLNHLAGYRELNIIGRTSSFAFGDRAYPAPKIAALLGVRFLLQGSVRRHENRVRVSTQLLDEQGVQLWSRNFDRQLTDIFDIQTEIADAVAQAVVPEVTARALTVRPANLEAYDQYLIGRDRLAARAIVEAVAPLQRAIELDPQFAPAHAELSVALAIRRQLGAARQAADAALALQPGLLRAQAARALILQQQSPPDWPASETLLRQVLAQDPNMTDALLWLANSLAAQGKETASDEVSLRALRLDPLHPSLVVNAAAQAAGQGDDRQAIAIARRAIESPDNRSYQPYVLLFDLYSTRGRLVDAARLAREWTQDSAQSDTLDNPCYCLLIWAHSLLGDWALADYWIDRSRRDFEGSWWAGYFQALTLRRQGRFADALGAAANAYREAFGALEASPAWVSMTLGTLEALAGDHAASIGRLAPLVGYSEMDTFSSQDALQALAWSYLQTGQAEEAGPLLADIERDLEALEQRGTLRFQLRETLHGYALNAALRGEPEQALDRLETIIGWGWRMVHLHRQDPRWGSLRDHPRFGALMAQVEADVARQRGELESIEPHEVFVARLDAHRATASGSPD